MARRRVKKRTHVGAQGTVNKNAPAKQSPKSMVLRMGAGEVGPNVSQLVKDVRSMMEPGTASRLKERRSNKLKDYITMAGPLGVSHLLLFSRSSLGNTNLRLALVPRGPTLHFKVEKYSLAKDIKRSIKHAKGGGKEFLTAPLLVMNNFTTQTPADPVTGPAVPKHLENLATSIFQSLFPPISPQTTPLASIRRVLLLNRETGPTANSYTLNLRHYAITTKPVGLSRGVRRLNAAEKLLRSRDAVRKKDLPNLGRLKDVSDYLLDSSAAAGFTSGSESEVETDAEVEVLDVAVQKVPSHKKRDKERAMSSLDQSQSKPAQEPQPQQQQQQQQSAQDPVGSIEKRGVKLVELGPRMTLRLTKVEEGVCGGKVLWHEYISKTKEEEQKMDETWDVRRREKEERRKQQRENVERKRKERGGGGAGKGNGAQERQADGADADMNDVDDNDDWDSEDEDFINEDTEMVGAAAAN
ncbi:MAG: hypothetical protein M1825_004035 [Sarcosagium campestre]|nr:MAG: hypothetical protein M1825_004035 [Sarcosagium campestre]